VGAEGSTEAVVARARVAQQKWADLQPVERARILEPTKDRILDRAHSIAERVQEDVGKPLVEALLGEVLPSADVVQYWTRHIATLLEATPVELDAIAYPRKSGTILREPRGVVAAIMPWNFPVALPLRTIVPALLAGNAVVFKPSEVAPRSGRLVAELFEGLLPDGLLQLLEGGAETGAALCAADVDVVVFIGSVQAGRKVAHACAERLIPCSLELGGKDAALVLGDADLARAANGVVWGAMMNAGQNCASVERVYVEKAVAKSFTDSVCAVVESLRPGVDVGPLATAAQRGIVQSHVREAVARGAELLRGGADGERGNGNGEGTRDYPPTVVRVTGEDTALMRDETFGPVLPIVVVENADEAVARANASRYGLTASIWSRDLRKAQSLARRLRAGVVTINNHAFTGAIPAAPWSGAGETGWGVTNSPLALEGLTRPRFVLVDRSRAARELWWYPYTPALRAIGSSMAVVRSARRPLMERLRALASLIAAFVQRARGG
jgi:acyl-CoA reductase-like NAD-dependent aldehyde dehydrogenase